MAFFYVRFSPGSLETISLWMILANFSGGLGQVLRRLPWGGELLCLVVGIFCDEDVLGW